MDFVKKNVPKVSIILPFFNHKAYIKESVQSILNQTFINFELLLINDGSTDESLQIAIELKKLDDRIKVFDNKHTKGVAGSTNTGIENSKGKYIAYIDVDDIADKDRILKQVDFLDKNKKIGVVGTWMREFEGGNNIWDFLTDPMELKVSFLVQPPVANPTAMYRKELILKEKIRYDETYPISCDYDFWTKMYSLTLFSNIPKILYFYRVRNDSISNSSGNSEFIFWKKSLSKLINIWGNDLDNGEYEMLFKMKYPNFSSFYAMNNKTVNKLILKIINLNKLKFSIFPQTELESFFKKKVKLWNS